MSTPPMRVRDLLEALAACDPDTFVEVEMDANDPETPGERERASCVGIRPRQDGRRWVVLEGA